MLNDFDLYKNEDTDQIMWVDNPDRIGEWVFTFDGEEFFNMFRDYPDKLTPEQKEIFDRENPYWANFFKNRS